MHRTARAFALLLLSSVFVAAVPAQDAGELAPDGDGSVASTPSAEEFARRAADELAEIGYRVDLEALTVESVSRREARRRDLRHAARDVGSLRDEAFVALLQGFGHWRYDDGAEFGEWIVRALERMRDAFWVPEECIVVVVESKSPSLPGVSRADAVVHSLVHAWRYERGGARESAPRTTEEARIRQCLREGEAYFVQTALRHLRDGGAAAGLVPELFSNPLAGFSTLELVALPDEVGGALACTAFRDGGFAAVRELWIERPASTEQVLHPEKLGRDLPREVTLPAWPAELPDAELLVEDVLGELKVYELLRMLEVERTKARLAAAGWDGDRIALYRTTRRGEIAVVWRTVWDSPFDARRFFETLSTVGDGEWNLQGDTVDWVRTVDGPLASRLLDRLEEHAAPAPRPVDDSDAKTTAAVERRLRGEAPERPFVAEDRWVVPRGGYSVPIPDGWETKSADETSILIVGNPTDGAMLMNLHAVVPEGETVEDLLDRSEELEGFGVEFDTIEVREVGGRRALWAHGVTAQGPGMLAWSVSFVDGVSMSQLTLVCSLPREDELRPDVERILDGLRFDAEEYGPPPRAEERDDDEEVAPIRQHFDLTVRDALSGRPVPEAEVLVAVESMELRLARPLRQIELAEARGRRFVTDPEGRVRVPFRDKYDQFALARAGNRCGVDSLFLYGLEPELRLAPTRPVVVRVIDGAGEPVRDVPVALVDRDDPASHNQLDGVTDRDGEARWELPYAELANFGVDLNDCASTFGFPVADQPLVPCGPNVSLDGPIVLEAPPTGSVRFELREPDDAEGGFGPRPWSATIEDADAEDAIAFRRSETRAARRFAGTDRTVYFSHVGLGLTLRIRPTDDSKGSLAQGPMEPGEEVFVEPGPDAYDEVERTFLFEEYAPETSNRLVGVCLRANGEPLTNTELLWGTNSARSDFSLPHFLREGSTRTDAEGRFEIDLPEGRLEVMTAGQGPDDVPEESLQRLVLRTTPEEGPVVHWSAVYLERRAADETYYLEELAPDASIRTIRVRVVDESGAPIEGSECWLEHQRTSGSSTRGPDESRGPHSEEHLWFGVESEGATLRVQAQAIGYERSEWIELPSGTGEREIRLKAATGVGRVRGKILLPRSDHVGAFGFYVERVDGPSPEAIVAVLDSRLGAIEFTFGGIEPGEYRLRLGNRGISPQAQTMDARMAAAFASDFVEVAEFTLEGDDLELGPIDLRDRLHIVRVRVVDAEGRPFEGRMTVSGSNAAGWTWSRSYEQGAGVAGTVMRSLDGGIDVRVNAEGYRVTVRTDVRGEVEIQLGAEGLDVRLALARVAELPREGDELVVVAKQGPDVSGSLLVERTRFEEGLATLRLPRDGTWRLHWYLVRDVDGEERRRRVFVSRSQRELEVRDADETQTFRFEPPDAESLRHAGDRMR